MYREQGQAQRIATIIESHKRSALPHYQGGRGYQPMLAVWAEANLVVADEFRDGNVPARLDSHACCRRCSICRLRRPRRSLCLEPAGDSPYGRNQTYRFHHYADPLLGVSSPDLNQRSRQPQPVGGKPTAPASDLSGTFSDGRATWACCRAPYEVLRRGFGCTTSP